MILTTAVCTNYVHTQYSKRYCTVF